MWVQEKTNTPFDVAEAILAHKVGNKVTAAYARSELLEKRRDVMEGWSSYLNLSSGQILKFEG